MRPVRLLVVSQACRERVNRAVYRRLSTHYDLDLHLVVPVRSAAASGHAECAPFDDEPFITTPLEAHGRHTRVERVRGLTQMIRTEAPTHVLVDAEVATMLVRDVTQASRASDTLVWVISNENRMRDFLREGFDGLLGGRPSLAIGGALARWLLRSSQRRLDHVFTISADGTRVMSHLGFSGRVTQMPLGFDPDLFHPQSDEQIAATRQRIGVDRPAVAYFGRLLPEKGIGLLLDALATMMDLRWQFLMDRFALYPSPYQSQLQRRIEELELTDRVVTFDATHGDMPDYMNAADIVVLPSITTPTFKEQYGRVVPEAMACGKIVVGSSSGAIPELIGDGGFVFPEGDMHALAGRLRSLLATPENELQIVRKRAEHRARTELSIVRQSEILYEKLNSSHVGVAPSRA